MPDIRDDIYFVSRASARVREQRSRGGKERGVMMNNVVADHCTCESCFNVIALLFFKKNKSKRVGNCRQLDQ